MEGSSACAQSCCQESQRGHLQIVHHARTTHTDAVVGQTLVEAFKHIAVHLDIGDIRKGAVGLLDRLEVDDTDIALGDSAEQRVFDFLRALVAVVGIAVLDIIPDGKNADGVVVGCLCDIENTRLHDILTLGRILNQTNGDIVFCNILHRVGNAVVKTDNRFATCDDIFGSKVMAFIVCQHSFGKLGIVVPIVADGARDNLHAEGVNQFHFLRQQTQGEIQQHGGFNLFALGEASTHIVDVGVGGEIEGVRYRAIHPQEQLFLAVCGGLIQKIGVLWQAFRNGKADKVHGLCARHLDQNIETVIVTRLDFVHKGGRVLLLPVGILHHGVHHGGGDCHRGVFHQGHQALLLQAYAGNTHLFELVQPPCNRMLALFTECFQFAVVQNDIIGLVLALDIGARTNDTKTNDGADGDSKQENGIAFQKLLENFRQYQEKSRNRNKNIFASKTGYGYIFRVFFCLSFYSHFFAFFTLIIISYF